MFIIIYKYVRGYPVKSTGAIEINPLAHIEALQRDLQERAEALSLEDLREALRQIPNRPSPHNMDVRLRPGILRRGVFLKADPDEATQQAVSNWYNLFCQDGIIAAPSMCMLLSRAAVPAAPPISSSTDSYLEHVVSCRTEVEGLDANLVLEALSMLSSWIESIEKPRLLELLKSIDSRNPQELKFEHIPAELIDQSGLFENKLPQEWNQVRLSAMLPLLLQILRKLIPNYTPERAIEECPKFFDRIDHYAFSALLMATLPVDPAHLAPSKIKVTMTVNADGAPCYRLVCSSAGKWGEVFDTPLMRSERGGHFNKVLSLLHCMRKQLSRPVHEEFRKEFLSRSPISWILEWSECLKLDDQRYQRLNLKTEMAVCTEANPDENALNMKPLGHDRSFPFELSPDRLSIMLSTLEPLYEAMMANPNITLQECVRIARPTISVCHEHFFSPPLDSPNLAKSLFEALKQVRLGQCVEDIFLGSAMISYAKGCLGQGYLDRVGVCFLSYRKLAEKHNLPSIENLARETKIPQLEDKSLFDLFKQFGHGRMFTGDDVYLSLNDAFEWFIQQHQVFPALVRVFCCSEVFSQLPLELCVIIATLVTYSDKKATSLKNLVGGFREAASSVTTNISQINRFSHFAQSRPYENDPNQLSDTTQITQFQGEDHGSYCFDPLA